MHNKWGYEKAFCGLQATAAASLYPQMSCQLANNKWVYILLVMNWDKYHMNIIH